MLPHAGRVLADSGRYIYAYTEARKILISLITEINSVVVT